MVTDSRDLAVLAARVAASKQAEAVVVFDVREVIRITDYFVIASGTSDRQVKTLADEVVRVALPLVVGLAHALPRAHRRYALMNSSRSPSMTASTLPISTPVRWSLMRCSGWNV